LLRSDRRDIAIGEPKTMPTRKLIIDTDPGVDDILAKG
jgi:hypothetical protein